MPSLLGHLWFSVHFMGEGNIQGRENRPPKMKQMTA